MIKTRKTSQTSKHGSVDRSQTKQTNLSKQLQIRHPLKSKITKLPFTGVIKTPPFPDCLFLRSDQSAFTLSLLPKNKIKNKRN